jgi:hypothetical protein
LTSDAAGAHSRAAQEEIRMRVALSRLTVTALFAWSLTAVGQTVDVEGVKFEPAVQVGGQTLQLNGTGVRTRAVFKVYAAGLYVPQKSTDARALVAQKGPRRITMALLRDVSADSFSEALNDGLKANNSDADLSALQSQIDALNASLKAVGAVKKGDTVLFEFVPDTGTRIVVNGQPRGASIPGEPFFAAVLRIWIGDKPVDNGLKKGLVGG